jgi:hypothetical protein
LLGKAKLFKNNDFIQIDVQDADLALNRIGKRKH